MALPSVAIILNLSDLAGDEVTTGEAVFTPTSAAVSADGTTELLAAPVTVDLSEGMFPRSAALLPTDVAGVQPSALAWQVSFPGVPGAPQPFTFLAPAGPVSFTGATGTPGILTWTATPALTRLPNGTGVKLAGGSLPAGVTAGTTYYVVGASGQTVQLSATPGGSPVALTGTGSGTLTVVSYYLAALVPVAASASWSLYMFAPVVRAKSGAYTAQNGDAVLADATAGAFAVTSPPATAGAQVRVKKVDASGNAVTFTPASGTVDGAAGYALATQYQRASFISDGTNWWVL